MTEYKATSEQWAEVESYGNPLDPSPIAGCSCILELRARVEALEAKYETMRLATLEWGEDVNKVKRWSDQHLQRIEALEGTRRPASKVYEISEPLQLTPEQAQQINDLLAPNSKPTPNFSQIGRSLVERVQQAINTEYEESLGTGSMEACAAIREVAAWLKEGEHTWAALKLEQEVQ
jgi:hypothetical protein